MVLFASQVIFHSPADLVNIRRVDEAVVIGAAMSLSSSAFVLKILQASAPQVLYTAHRQHIALLEMVVNAVPGASALVTTVHEAVV